MWTGNSLEIVLDNPEVLVRGSFDEASPVIISGKLVVHLHETIRVRSLKLSFSGRIDIFASQNSGGNSSKDEHREITAQEWVFLEPQKPAVTWGPESKVFAFDMLFPGDNPETVVTALGKVKYQLHATLERTGFHANLNTNLDVAVKRGPMPGAPWALALMESIETSGNWERQLEYRVSVPTRSLKDGELFHTRFELEPRTKGLKLMAVGVLIKEYARYYSALGEPLARNSRVITRNENYIGPEGSCSTQPMRADACMDLLDATSVQIPMVVPDAYDGIQYDVLTDLIEVRHRIKFLIKIRDASMLVHNIFIAVPVSIMPVTARDDSNILPRYETALLNPGTVIMRSSTLPPAYDLSAAAAAEQLCPAIGQGTDIDGFPGPLHRSESQFYLASPDISPPMSPAGNTRAAEPISDIPTTTAMAPSPAQHSTDTALLTHSGDTLTERSRRSSISSKHSSFLPEYLTNGKISDKVRAIFHSRHNSQTDEHGSTGSIIRSVTPPLPVHVNALSDLHMRHSATPQPLQKSLSAASVSAGRYRQPVNFGFLGAISLQFGAQGQPQPEELECGAVGDEPGADVSDGSAKKPSCNANTAAPTPPPMVYQ
ncbi:hypothetical protein BX661DRAFT_187649 [Kickxella alabastrina]|uniref:uncharacterized protein n=1 Tax=Kickxella alabastrina TaxID=61397 RepID=UPI00221FAA1C|nr:uncharacterized protein BX661DRAFT_187649 [Kickxella alabastrina]KAI7822297.1 hypothetical protein BX661DRAFT_187649 [Kickxella alabastrina]KAJ1946642.1 hypothetical protein GGF37_001034 [Kickxella alabastrina]